MSNMLRHIAESRKLYMKPWHQQLALHPRFALSGRQQLTSYLTSRTACGSLPPIPPTVSEKNPNSEVQGGMAVHCRISRRLILYTCCYYKWANQVTSYLNFSQLQKQARNMGGDASGEYILALMHHYIFPRVTHLSLERNRTHHQ